jgi:hypothetical protein
MWRRSERERLCAAGLAPFVSCAVVAAAQVTGKAMRFRWRCRRYEMMKSETYSWCAPQGQAPHDMPAERHARNFDRHRSLRFNALELTRPGDWQWPG